MDLHLSILMPALNMPLFRQNIEGLLSRPQSSGGMRCTGGSSMLFFSPPITHAPDAHSERHNWRAAACISLPSRPRYVLAARLYSIPHHAPGIHTSPKPTVLNQSPAYRPCKLCVRRPVG